MVETCQGLDEHVDAFVAVLVSARGEEEKSVVGIKVIGPVEVPANEIQNLCLGQLMQVLEFMRRGELLDVKTVWQNTVGLSLKEMFALVSRNVRYSGEDVRGMGSCSLNAVSVVDTTLSSLRVHVKVLQVVVEVDGSSAQVSAQQRCVCREDGRNVDAPLLAEGECHPSEPFVELRDYCPRLVVVNVLRTVSPELVPRYGYVCSYLAQEPSNQISEYDSFIRLVVTRG